MTFVSFHRGGALRKSRAVRRNLPMGFGLALSALISLAMWAGIIWGAFQLFT